MNCSIIISEWVNNILTIVLVALVSIIFVFFMKRVDIIFNFSLLVLITIFPISQQIITGTPYSGAEYKGIFKISLFSLLILNAAIFLFFSKTKLYNSNKKLLSIYALLVFIILLASIMSEGFRSIAIIVENFITPLGIMYIMLNLRIDEIIHSLGILKIGIVINFILGLIEFITNKNIFESDLIELKKSMLISLNHIRSYGLVQHPLNYAFVGLVSISIFIITRKRKDFAFVIIGIIMTIISISRAGIFLAIILGTVSLFILSKISEKKILTILLAIPYIFLVVIGAYIYFLKDKYDVYSKLSRIIAIQYFRTSFFSNLIVGYGLKQSMLADELSQMAKVNIIPENPTIILGSAYGYVFSLLLLFGLIFMISHIKDLYQRASCILLLIYLQTFNSYGTKYVYFNLFIYLIWLCILVGNVYSLKVQGKIEAKIPRGG